MAYIYKLIVRSWVRNPRDGAPPPFFLTKERLAQCHGHPGFNILKGSQPGFFLLFFFF